MVRSLLCSIIFCSVTLASPTFPLQVENYNEQQGLISSSVHACVQDRNGLMWFGTRNGLCTFNGQSWNTPKVQPSMQSIPVHFLEKDAEGTLWALSVNGNAILFAPELPRSMPRNLYQPHFGMPSIIVGFKVLSAGKTMSACIVTKRADIFVFKAGEWHSLGKPRQSDSLKAYCLETHQDSFVLGTNVGLFEINSTLNIEPLSLSLPNPMVLAMKRDPQTNKLWIAGKTWIGYQEMEVFHIYKDFEGNIFDPPLPGYIEPVPCGGFILSNSFSSSYFSDEPKKSMTPIQDFGTGSNFLYRDNEMNIWLCNERGVQKLHHNFFLPTSGMDDQEVTAIIQKPTGEVIFGHPKGLTIWDRGKIETFDFSEEANTKADFRILDLAIDSKGWLWFSAQYAGLGAIDTKGQKHWFNDPQEISLPVMSVQTNHEGDLLILSEWESPIMKWENNKFEPYLVIPIKSSRRRFKTMEDDTVFVFTYNNGVLQYKNDKWTYYTDDSNPLINNTYCLLDHPKFGLLVGTKAGLFMAKYGHLEPFQFKNFQNDRPVYVISTDAHGGIWLGTDYGLVYLKDDDCQQFNLSSGLPGLECNRAGFLEDSQGQLFFGTNNGSAMFNRTFWELSRDIPEPNLQIDLKGFEPNSNQQQIDIPQSQKILFFQFQALYYGDTASVEYRTRLKGLEKKWNPVVSASENLVRYINLPAGNYQLEVQAKLPQTSWGKSFLSKQVHVEIQFWQTTWFKWIVVVLLLLLGFLTMRQRLNYSYTRRLKQEIQETTQKLEESELAYSQLFKNSPIGMYRTTPDGEILAANPAMKTMLGLSKDESQDSLELQDVGSYYAIETRKRFKEQLEKDKSISGWTTTLLRKDGNYIHIREHAIVINDENGKPKYYEGTIEDITESKRISQELKNEKERLWKTIEALKDGVIATDSMGKIQLMNPAAEAMLGVKLDGIHSELMLVFQVMAITDPDNPGEEVKWLRQILSGKVERISKECYLKAAGRARFRCQLSCQGIHGSEGKIRGSVIVFRDISEEYQVKENQIKHQKLESLALLAGGIAHDFNNMLTSILGNIQLAKMESEPILILNKLEASEKAIIKAKGLTQQLLTFSRGGQPVKEQIDLKPLVLDTVKFSSSGTAVDVSFDIPADIYPIFCDPGQITQVISNLTINAIQAMAGKGALKISIERIQGNPDTPPFLQGRLYYLMHFADTGHGIKKENLDRIFDPYYTTKEFGSGLGLATSYSIVNQHEGLITVDSEVHKGTTFSVYLPASEEAIRISKFDTHDIQGGKVLLLDDDEMVLEVGTSILETIGFDVIGTTTGEQTIEIFKEAQTKGIPFDLVILDLTLPGGIDGKETMERLLELDPHISGIVSSGYSNDDVMSHPQRYGFKAVLSKPYTLQNLKETLYKVLGKSGN